MASSEFAYVDGRDHCRVQLSTALPKSREAADFVLDIDSFLVRSGEVAVADGLAWVDEAHDRVEAIFEGCVTVREL